MPQTNIQTLFARISVADIREYLLSRGWRREAAEQADTLRFATSAKEPGESMELWTWSPETHPKFRRRVPDLVFTLSVHEDRPALDIANEMFGMGLRAAEALGAANRAASGAPAGGTPSAGSAPAGPVCWSLTNRGADTRILQIVPDGGTHALEPGERVTVVYQPADAARAGGPPVDVAFAESAVLISCPPNMAGTRLFQGVAPAAGKRAAPVSAIVAEELARMPSPDGTDATAAYLERLGDTLRRIEFELDFEGEPDARIQQTFRRQTAILIVALARLLPLTPLTRQAIWRTALRTMAAAGLGLELYAPAVDELYFTAAADQESSPVATLALLQARTIQT